MTPDQRVSRYRWFALAIFLLSSTLNYLDRQIFAILGPTICPDPVQFGLIVGIFSAAYALAAPLAGAAIDRVGLVTGSSLAVGFWSLAGIATGFTSGIPSLIGCRTALAVAEAGGIPAAGKAIHGYMKASERALGNAVNLISVNLGLMAAPPLAAWCAGAYGWRSAFLITGAFGFVWIPLWNLAARAIPPAPVEKPTQTAASLGGDPRLWAIVAANALTMVGYSLWTNWLQSYLQREQHLSLREAAAYAWIPPAFAMAPGLAGGWLSARLAASGLAPAASRYRVCLIMAAISVATLAIPFAHTPALATAEISISFGAVAAMSANLYSLPLDVFGGARAASAVSALVASYGAMQFVASPLFGWVVRTHGFAPLMIVAAFTPALACVVLRRSGVAS